MFAETDSSTTAKSATPRGQSPGMNHEPRTRIIDCAECSMYESDHCSDCVVTYLCDPVRRDSTPVTAVVFDLAELRAVKLLAEAGLVPDLRHSATG